MNRKGDRTIVTRDKIMCLSLIESYKSFVIFMYAYKYVLYGLVYVFIYTVFLILDACFTNNNWTYSNLVIMPLQRFH